MYVKIIMIGVVIAFCGCVFSAGCVLEDTPVYPDTTPEMYTILSDVSSEIINRSLDVSETLQVSAKVLPYLELGGSEFQAVIIRTYSDIPYFLDVFYCDYETSAVYGYPYGHSEDRNLAGFRLSGEKEVELFRTFDTTWHRNVMVVGVPVYSENGTMLGGLYAVMGVTGVPSSVVREHPEMEDYFLTIDTSDGIRVYHPGNEGVGGEVPYSRPDVSGASGVYTYKDVFGHPVSAVYQKVMNLFGEEVIISLNVRENISSVYRLHYDESASAAGLKEALQTVYLYANFHSKGETISYIENLNTSSSPYLFFAMNLDGTVYASSNSIFDGFDIGTVQDPYGVSLSQVVSMRAMQGSGFVHGYQPVSYEGWFFEGMPTLSYVISMGDDWYLLASMVTHDSPVRVNNTKLSNVTLATGEALEYMLKYGDAAFYLAIANGGVPSFDDVEIMMISYEGILLSSSLDPELVGGDAFGIVDLYSNSIARSLVIMAKEGGGYMYYSRPMENGKGAMLYLCYVNPVYDTGMICTMVPLMEIEW